LPGRADSFRSTRSEGSGLDMDEGNIAFIGSSSPTAGVYSFNIATGQYDIIADTDTLIPDGGAARFDRYFDGVSIENGHVAFGYGELGFGPNGPIEIPFYGIYANLDGSLRKVLSEGDILEGQVVSRTSIGRQGLDGGQIAFSVSFTNRTSAIYVATPIPEPATLALLIAACSVTAFAIRRMQTSRRS